MRDTPTQNVHAHLHRPRFGQGRNERLRGVKLSRRAPDHLRQQEHGGEQVLDSDRAVARVVEPREDEKVILRHAEPARLLGINGGELAEVRPPQGDNEWVVFIGGREAGAMRDSVPFRALASLAAELRRQGGASQG